MKGGLSIDSGSVLTLDRSHTRAAERSASCFWQLRAQSIAILCVACAFRAVRSFEELFV